MHGYHSVEFVHSHHNFTSCFELGANWWLFSFLLMPFSVCVIALLITVQTYEQNKHNASFFLFILIFLFFRVGSSSVSACIRGEL
jgi:hypothetical protein